MIPTMGRIATATVSGYCELKRLSIVTKPAATEIYRASYPSTKARQKHSKLVTQMVVMNAKCEASFGTVDSLVPVLVYATT